LPGRNREIRVPYTYVTFPGPVIVNVEHRKKFMQDATGPKPYPERAMYSVDRVSIEGSVTNRPPATSGGTGDVGYPSIMYNDINNGQLDLASSFPPMSTLVMNLLANTNPGTPAWNLPLFWAELRDVPKMLKHAGDLLLGLKKHGWRKYATQREIAAGNLALKFGWQPIIDDLLKVCDFQEYVDRRMKDLKRLQSGKGQKRRSTVWRFDNDGSYVATTMVGRAPAIPMTVKIRSYERATGVVTWQPQAGALIPTSRSEALRLALGVNPGNIALTLWQSIPWSWMIDWFAGVSSFLAAHANSWMAYPTRVTITQKTTTYCHHEEYPLGSGALAKLTKGVRVKEKKQRFVPSIPVYPPLRIPILDFYKVSVLGSLAVLRAKSPIAS
jgi:hypothetical protein